MHNVYIETYGCWLNKAETEVIKTILRKNGYTIVQDLEDADMVIINTCAVREDVERRMFRRLREIGRKEGKFKVIVAGCLAVVRPASIVKIIPRAVLISPDNIERIMDAIKGGNHLILGASSRCILPDIPSSHRYVVPIASGCLGNCAFCVGKFARPRLKSYPKDVIVDAISRAVERGVREIYLTAQDVAAYGVDIGTNIVELLNDILSRIHGEYIIRLGMMEPSLVLIYLDELVEIYRDPRVYKYLHMPIQSGDDRVLKLMNRKYNTDDIITIVEKFRREFPELNFATDIIVGFPGEDDEAFNNTVRIIEYLKPDKVHFARYALRPFTKAYLMPQVPEYIKKRRSRMLSKVVEKVTLERNMQLVGKCRRAIVSDYGLKENTLICRLLNYKPVVISREPNLSLGDIIDVKILDATPIYLRGKILGS